MCPHEFYLGTCTCIFFKKIKPRGVGVGVEYGGVRVQGMCPHEFFLKNQAKGCGCGCGCGVWGCEGARDVST